MIQIQYIVCVKKIIITGKQIKEENVVVRAQ